MQCQICNNRDATIHLTEITDGARSEMHVCEQCAAEQGIAVKSHIPINELLSSLLAAQPADDELLDPTERKSHGPQFVGLDADPVDGYAVPLGLGQQPEASGLGELIL